MSRTQLKVDHIHVELHRKRMKNLRLVVLPPNGDVRVSAPMRVPKDEICHFVRSHISWIESQRAIYDAKPPVCFADGEVFTIWGDSKTIRLHSSRSPRAEEIDDELHLYLPRVEDKDARESVIFDYCRRILEKEIPGLVTHFQELLGVDINEWRLKRMKTRWGSCNISAKRIWLNVELAKYPKHCLAYVVAHELSHLLERSHNRRFWSIVESVFPAWRKSRDRLNRD